MTASASEQLCAAGLVESSHAVGVTGGACSTADIQKMRVPLPRHAAVVAPATRFMPVARCRTSCRSLEFNMRVSPRRVRSRPTGHMHAACPSRVSSSTVTLVSVVPASVGQCTDDSITFSSRSMPLMRILQIYRRGNDDIARLNIHMFTLRQLIIK